VNKNQPQPVTTSDAGSSQVAVDSGDCPSIDDLRAMVKSLQEELVACQRLAVLGNLAAMAAHEFNNLMTPIVARAEAALTMGDDVAFMRKSLQRTLTQSQRAIALSKHLLELAHNEYHPTEMCSVASAVREAIETATRPFEKDGIDLRVSVPEDLRVFAREDLLCQVLLNLLLNAREAMKDREGTLAIDAAQKDGFVQIDVRDSGTGIPQDKLDKVFNLFLAADPHEQPTDWHEVGLGLSVCRMITAQHNATLRAFANADCGCTFRLRWPVDGARRAEQPT
jgi:signal transduction histidine kinase